MCLCSNISSEERKLDQNFSSQEYDCNLDIVQNLFKVECDIGATVQQTKLNNFIKILDLGIFNTVSELNTRS